VFPGRIEERISLSACNRCTIRHGVHNAPLPGSQSATGCNLLACSTPSHVETACRLDGCWAWRLRGRLVGWSRVGRAGCGRARRGFPFVDFRSFYLVFNAHDRADVSRVFILCCWLRRPISFLCIDRLKGCTRFPFNPCSTHAFQRWRSCPGLFPRISPQAARSNHTRS
jgi:hypothetical protein